MYLLLCVPVFIPGTYELTTCPPWQKAWTRAIDQDLMLTCVYWKLLTSYLASVGTFINKIFALMSRVPEGSWIREASHCKWHEPTRTSGLQFRIVFYSLFHRYYIQQLVEYMLRRQLTTPNCSDRVEQLRGWRWRPCSKAEQLQ